MDEDIISKRALQSQVSLESTVLSKHTRWDKHTGEGACCKRPHKLTQLSKGQNLKQQGVIHTRKPEALVMFSCNILNSRSGTNRLEPGTNVYSSMPRRSERPEGSSGQNLAPSWWSFFTYRALQDLRDAFLLLQNVEVLPKVG